MKGGRDAGGEARGGQGVMDGSRSAGPSAELKEGKGNEKMRGVVEDTSLSLGVSQFDSKSFFFYIHFGSTLGGVCSSERGVLKHS